MGLSWIAKVGLLLKMGQLEDGLSIEVLAGLTQRPYTCLCVSDTDSMYTRRIHSVRI